MSMSPTSGGVVGVGVGAGDCAAQAVNSSMSSSILMGDIFVPWWLAAKVHAHYGPEAGALQGQFEANLVRFGRAGIRSVVA